ncbi:hypothetical protein HanHA300_Chr03g0094341 [Helianthus annuus]|nr:hypothetical protein HanHA300_Chr03g0094341 [Helianthus annuus]KAJ0608212.1 hypothetical protein HanHA89_Chr03g0106061 [Helianthus annuus]KAJ0768275.1 hypothetical protein HanLR1_Chr03g0099411 [Helianthus annuus]
MSDESQSILYPSGLHSTFNTKKKMDATIGRPQPTGITGHSQHQRGKSHSISIQELNLKPTISGSFELNLKPRGLVSKQNSLIISSFPLSLTHPKIPNPNTLYL